MTNVQKCALLGISDSWCINPWARFSRIKVQIPPWFPPSPIAGSHIVRHDPGRRSPTSFDCVLSRWCSCNMMMSATLPNKYSSRSLLSFHLFCWSSRLLSPCTFHVTIFILMEWGGALPIAHGALHNRSWVGSTHHLDIQSFPGMECWSKSKSGVCGLAGALQ